MASLDALTAGRRLLDATSAPRFAAPGSLVFQREAALVTQAIDLDRGSGSRLTAPELFPWGLAWSADDREIATWLNAPARAESASNEGSLSLVSTANGALRRLLPPSSRWILPLDFSADGRTLLYVELASGRGYDLGWLRLDGEPILTAYLATLANESKGRLSPDARWLAYLSEASGRREAFVDSFPDPARAQRVALDGEVERVRFRADGRELFLVAAGGDAWAVFACDLRLRERAEIGPPRKLFSLPPEWSALEPLPSGDRFLLLEPAGGRWPSLTLVENWRSQLALPGESG